MKRLRVLFLSQYFPPEIAAAPMRAAHFARALERAGHEVIVVTGLPNHPSGVIDRSVSRETTRWEGVEVRRAWLFATPKKRAWTRLWNHLSFALSAFPAALAVGRVDAVLVTTPPLFIGVTARFVAWLRGAPLVLDCRDDWPQAALALGEMKPGFVANVLAGIANGLYHAAARVICANPGMARSLPGRGVDAKRVLLVTNGADTDVFRPVAAPPRRAGEPALVLYSGTHGLIHAMDTLMDAVVMLAPRRDLRFLFVGDGVMKPQLEARARELQLANVEFRPSLPAEELAGLVTRADVCVATMRDHPFCNDVIPVKVFDYLAAGRPVVASLRGDAAEVVERSGGGVVVAPGDARALADAIAALADAPERGRAMGEAGARYVEEHYSRRALGDRLASTVEDVVRARRGRQD